MEDFLKTLFNLDEGACAGTPYDTKVVPVTSLAGTKPNFIVINPLKERRLDANVTAFRSFLIESDKVEVKKQLEAFRTCELPVSTLTYSGNDSIHAVISLAEPLPSALHLRVLAKAIYNALDTRVFKAPVVDRSTVNPSRFTRFPGAIHPKTGRVQELLECRGRQPLEEVERWVRRHSRSFSLAKAVDKAFRPVSPKLPPPYPGAICKRVRDFLKTPPLDKNWNTELYYAARAMAIDGYSLDYTIDLLGTAAQPLDSVDIKTVRSAYSKAG